jgi:hypothetical protein
MSVNLKIGTGSISNSVMPVEKTVDIAVARRFKKRGMSWHRKCANPLLKLRLLKLNGEKDIYWQERRKEVARYAL